MSKNTNNLNLNLPEYGSSNWGEDLNDNFVILDTAVREALDGNTNFIIAPEPPLSPKFGQVWIDTSEGQNSDGLVKGTYKVYNGDEFEEYQFKTDSSLVMLKDKALDTAIDDIESNIDSNMESVKAELQNKDNKIIDLSKEITNHEKGIHTGEKHGIRLNSDKKLEYFDGNEWLELKGGGYPVNIAKNLSVYSDDRELLLTWEDPNDVIVEGQTVAKWKATKLVRKLGGIPMNENDGTVVVSNGVRNQYKNKPFIDTGLTNDKEYGYSVFPVSEDDVVTIGSKGVKGVPIEPIIYGVVIDEDNSNPKTRVKYIDDAIGFKPVRGNDGNTDWGSWKDTFIYDNFKPCIYKGGEVQYYLDKDDRTKKEDGSPAILTGEDGDVMVEISKMWLRMYKDGTDQYIKITNKETIGYQCLAHTNGDKEVDKIYVGAYLGYEQSGKLRSISGKVPVSSKTIRAFRTIAEANGDNYHQVPFYSLQLLQAIMTIMLRNTDTQTALGLGHTDDSNGYSVTGNTNNKPMMYGETKGQRNSGQVCFMGIEDFWGNKRWWIDGCKYDGGNIKTATTGFNDNATGYDNVGKYSTGSGYMENIKGSNKTGFIPDERNGSTSAYYCDDIYVTDGGFPLFGGYRMDRGSAGGFYLYSYPASFSNISIGARLFAYGK